MSPDWVNATRYFAPIRSATSAAALAITPPRVRGCQSIAAIRASPWSSVDSMMRAIVSHGLDGVLPHARLAGQHHRVGAVEHGVGDVGGLRAGRPRRGDHRLEHLGRDDDRLGVPTGDLDDLLLQERHVLERHSTPRSPRATMMPSNASTISSMFSIACGFSILAITGRKTSSSFMIARTSSTSAAERTKDSAMKSTRQVQRPAQVLLVLLGQRGHATRRHRAG